MITRESILKTVGDILRCFAQDCLQRRVFVKFSKMIFKHEPAIRNHYYRPIYCVRTDCQICTLSHDVKRLEQKRNGSDTHTPNVGESYFINEEAKARPAKIITNIDEMLNVVRDIPQPEDPNQKQALALLTKTTT